MSTGGSLPVSHGLAPSEQFRFVFQPRIPPECEALPPDLRSHRFPRAPPSQAIRNEGKLIGHTAVVHDKHVYIFGGVTEHQTFHSAVTDFDIGTHQWGTSQRYGARGRARGERGRREMAGVRRGERATGARAGAPHEADARAMATPAVRADHPPPPSLPRGPPKANEPTPWPRDTPPLAQGASHAAGAELWRRCHATVCVRAHARVLVSGRD